MFAKYHTFSRTLWQYLNQPLFDDLERPMLHPRRFWYTRRVEMLERCLGIHYTAPDQRRE